MDSSSPRRSELVSPAKVRMAKAGVILQRGKRLLIGSGARQGYLAAMDQAVISLANFLATLLLARYASPTELGIYAVGIVCLNLLRNTTEGLIIQPLNVLSAGMDKEGFSRYTSGAAVVQIVVNIIAAGAAAVTGWVLTLLGNDTAGPAIFSLWVVFLLWPLQEYVRRLLYIRGMVMAAVGNTLLSSFVRLGLMIYLIQSGSLNGVRGLQAVAWGAGVGVVWGLAANWNVWTLRQISPKEVWKLNLPFGKWMAGGTITNWASVEFYPVLTAGMISFAAAGAYRALQNLVAPIHMILRATDTFMTPRAARDYQQFGAPSLVRLLRGIYLVNGIPVLGMLAAALLFPAQILRFFYGETYLPYKTGIVYMSIFYALWFAYWPLQTALKACRVSRPIFVANTLAIGIMLTLGILAIRRWGVYGTIIGQIMNAATINLVLWSAWKGLRRGWQNAAPSEVNDPSSLSSSEKQR